MSAQKRRFEEPPAQTGAVSLEKYSGRIAHLSQRYTLTVHDKFVTFTCKKSGREVFQLDVYEFRELKRNKQPICKTLVAIHHDGDVISSYTCRLSHAVIVTILPGKPYLCFVHRGDYQPLQLTCEEYNCLAWFTDMEISLY